MLGTHAARVGANQGQAQQGYDKNVLMVSGDMLILDFGFLTATLDSLPAFKPRRGGALSTAFQSS
jgi:hypothetical protein